MKKILTSRYTVASVLVVTLLVWALVPRNRHAGTVREHRVETRMLGLTITERGYLTSGKSMAVHVQASGEILELVKSGTHVKTGDTVLRTETTDLDERIEDRELSIHGVGTEKEVHQAEYKLQQIKATNDLAVLNARLEFARLRYSIEKAGLTDEERRLLAIDERIAALDLEDAADELARQKRLFEKKFISRSALEPFERRVESGRERIKELETRTALRAKGIPPEELLELKREAERLAALLKRNTAARARRLEQVRTRIAVSDAKMAKEMHELNGMKNERSLSMTKAPTNGIVSLRLMRDWGSGGRWTEYKPGVRVHRNDRIADIINPGAMTVQIMIHESDFPKMKSGQGCTVRLPAFPGRKLLGHISEIGGIGRDRYDVAPRGFDDSHTGITVFNASIPVHGDSRVALRPGMSALVSIVVEPPAERLTIPRAAVSREGDGFSVLKKGRFGQKKQAIKGRVYDEHYFVVEEGLEPGDIVLVPDESEDA
ncbi:HlyD family secretion protein [Verrucomicrobiota bacterium]